MDPGSRSRRSLGRDDEVALRPGFPLLLHRPGKAFLDNGQGGFPQRGEDEMWAQEPLSVTASPRHLSPEGRGTEPAKPVLCDYQPLRKFIIVSAEHCFG